ncbi:MAG: type IIL restriction-modification enzyme MmeI, partial [Candidatus Dormibacteria bacterium]
GFTITRAIQSKSWPAASANLEYAAVWGSRRTISAAIPRVADDVLVELISTLLEPAGRVEGTPIRLAENSGIAFQGCIVLGMGFVLEPEEATAWIEADPRNVEILFPYLNGEDLNSRPDTSPSRWVIDLGERAKEDAKQFHEPWTHLEQHVRPVRAKNDATKYPRMVHEWWKFWNARPTMRKAIVALDQMLLLTRHSVTLMPCRVAKGPVPSEATVVFATDSYVDQAVLSSSPHQMWAIKYGSGLRKDPRYTPSGVFETFPQPRPTRRLAEVGRTLDAERREIMLRRDLGLTKLYNLVNDRDVADTEDADVERMREIHVELDRAVMDAYGWSDVPLEHGFHTYRQMRRWTVSPTARVEILDRLLEENHRRAATQGEAPPPVDPDDESADE